MMQNSKFCMATLIGSAAMAFFMQHSENEELMPTTQEKIKCFFNTIFLSFECN